VPGLRRARNARRNCIRDITDQDRLEALALAALVVGDGKRHQDDGRSPDNVPADNPGHDPDRDLLEEWCDRRADQPAEAKGDHDPAQAVWVALNRPREDGDDDRAQEDTSGLIAGATEPCEKVPEAALRGNPAPGHKGKGGHVWVRCEHEGCVMPLDYSESDGSSPRAWSVGVSGYRSDDVAASYRTCRG
jgi:hypothetical protein